MVSILPFSHFNMFDLNGRTFGAVGSWESENEFTFLIYCAEAPNGNQVTIKFNDNGLTISTKSTYPEGGWHRREVNDLVFNLI